MSKSINILSIAKNVKTLGPGNRMVIWVQGCPFNCKGCITPEGIPLEINTLVSINKLAQEIIEDESIDGITFSGGEPFMQASKLNKLIDIVNASDVKMNYICFTGFEHEKLDWEEANLLLGKLDLLIDGKYVKNLNDNKGLRGSSNQNLIFLSDKLEKYENELLKGNRSLDIRITDSLQSIGIPNKIVNL